MEWDTAAADAIVREAGKNTYKYEKGIGYWIQGVGEENNPKPNTPHPASVPLIYNKENLLNPWFVAR